MLDFSGYAKIPVKWGPLGYIVYKRTYARKINDRKEEWWETLSRCVNALVELGLSEVDAADLYQRLFSFKCSLSGRALWQLGTGTVKRIGADSLQNCWCVAIDSPNAFTFAFNELMLGGGVGFNIAYESVYKLPIVKFHPEIKRINSNDVDFIVPDNREGWVKLLGKILNCYFYTGKNLTYSTSCIRQKGCPIETFGGIATGSEILVKGLEQICSILRSRYLKQLRPVDCGDIANIIGQIVVSGNVRRSAEILAGSHNDSDFLLAKNWNQVNVPSWRGASNNTLIVNNYSDLPVDFWEGYMGNGEPYGIINLENCKKYGRMIDGPGYREDNFVVGTNPCGEITLESYEPCNLSEVFLPNIVDVEDFKATIRLLFMVCRAITNLPYIEPETQSVVLKNRRVGISVSGLAQSRYLNDCDFFDEGYRYLEDLNSEYAKTNRQNESIKLTTVKPSGTVSLLPGFTPGIHAAYAQYYIRRIRMASDDQLVQVCKDANYNVEPMQQLDGSLDYNTMVVDFPISVPQGTILAGDLDAIDQLETLKMMQEWWSDNSVSTTIYYKKEELNDIRNWLSNNLHNIKTVSFLLHSEHGFKQAPYEEITEEKYKEMVKDLKPLTSVEGEGLEENLECSKGSCPIK